MHKLANHPWPIITTTTIIIIIIIMTAAAGMKCYLFHSEHNDKSRTSDFQPCWGLRTSCSAR